MLALLVINATFNIILVIPWWLVLLWKVTGVLGENTEPADLIQDDI